MLALITALALGASVSSPSPALVAQFRARDQAMLDAIAPGNRAVWDRVLSPNAIYVDENGNVTSRAGLIAQLVPLPPGSSGRITITGYTLHAWNDIAVVVHKDAEVENWHGQLLKANYITTETWRRDAGDWKLVLSHAYVVAKDPPTISVPASRLDELVGRYQAGPGVIDAVLRDGDHLTIARRGKPPERFLFEAWDLLFIPGSPRFHWLVQRDGLGRLTGFIQRREGEDVRWTRLP